MNIPPLNIPRFEDPIWDTMDSKERERILVHLIARQLEFAKQQTPFLEDFYREVKPEDLESLEDCATKIPSLHKEQIRALASPYDLLPRMTRENMGSLFIHRGTGGTTGLPTSVLYTYADWAAVMAGNSRSMKDLKPLFASEQVIAFHGYQQGHISGPYFEGVVRSLGAAIITRNFGSDDESAIKQMIAHQCNLIIAPAISTHKGGSLTDLLSADASLGTNYMNGKNIKALVISSTGITQDLYDELKDLGIENIINMYGSTDVGAIANSKPLDPFTLYANLGHSYLFVVDKKQRPVAPGERGLLIAGRIAGYDQEGKMIPNTGTQLLNFHLGDEVGYEINSSGRPYIYAVQRVENAGEKIEGGCQNWT